MIGKPDKFWGGSEKQSAFSRWRLAADCSRGGFQLPEMHDLHLQIPRITIAYLYIAIT